MQKGQKGRCGRGPRPDHPITNPTRGGRASSRTKATFQSILAPPMSPTSGQLRHGEESSSNRGWRNSWKMVEKRQKCQASRSCTKSWLRFCLDLFSSFIPATAAAAKSRDEARPSSVVSISCDSASSAQLFSNFGSGSHQSAGRGVISHITALHHIFKCFGKNH